MKVSLPSRRITETMYWQFTSGMVRLFTTCALWGGRWTSIPFTCSGVSFYSWTSQLMASAAAWMGDPTLNFLMFVNMTS